MSFSPLTIKQLYGFSCNECAHPECSQTLVEIDERTKKAVNYGEIAHIHGQKPGAERFVQEIYDNKKSLHGFDNLILLCGKHHTQIDQRGAGETYTADLIREWKSSHILKSTAENDREWVFGGKTINFFYDEQQVILSYWITKSGQLRFHSQEQLEQTNAARDVSILLAQLSSLLSVFEQVSGEPDDPYNQTMNDGYMRMLKNNAEDLKKSLSGTSPEGGYESVLHRIYDNLRKCPDVTLSELAELGTEKRAMRTTLIFGEPTLDRIADAIENAKDASRKSKGE